MPHRQITEKSVVGYVMQDRPFQPVLLTCAGAYVKFYSIAVLKQQAYDDACLHFKTKGPAPEWAGTRGFIVRRGKEVLGYRCNDENTFHPLV